MDEMAGELPNATTILVPGADHFVPLEPENRPVWAAAILDFLGS